ncbi:CBO0543 family protein [Alkalihalobacillus deserti]|uniref:CBO0543 family protein n=1 Tax=Alkalihalobacillus deserti TaxID=2879466 RepID=UPI0035567E56
MKQTFEKNVLRFLLIFGLIACINITRKPPAKDWVIVFLFKGFLASILDKVIVRGGYIKYPVKLAKCCDISFVFDYLIYPIICVYYNQVTKTSNYLGILIKTLCFSIPMGIIEHFLEKRTSLISFHKGWNSFISFFTMSNNISNFSYVHSNNQKSS